MAGIVGGYRSLLVDCIFKPSPIMVVIKRRKKIEAICAKTGLSEPEAAEFVDAIEALKR